MFPNTNINSSAPSFEVSDFSEFSNWFERGNENNIPAFSSFSAGHNPQALDAAPREVIVNSSGINNSSFPEGTIQRDAVGDKERKERGDKVAFKTKSEIEILDDGFKWRKYGKKKVKNSPNPRNYYKCSVEGCPVKKRVERDTEDERYVVTTYEGVHNHEGPAL